MSNKITVNKTTNEVTVSSAGTVGPQGGSGTIDSATATATAVAVDSEGLSQDPTVALTLGGTAAARTMAFAFGVPTGSNGVINTITTVGTDGIEIDSGATMNTAASGVQFGINAQTLWTHILAANVTGDALTVSDGSNTSPIALEGTITFSPVANETTVVENAGTITMGLVDNPVVSGATAGNVRIGVTGDNEVDTTTGNLTLDSAGGTVTVDDNLTVSGDLTVSGSSTVVDTTVTVSDAVVVNNAGSDVGVKVNSTSSGHVMQLQDNGTDVFVVNDGGKVAVGVPGNAASLLHLRGPSGADTDLRLEGTPGSADGVVANIDAYHGSNNVGKIRFKRGADAADGEIEFFTANDTLNSAAMHIDQNSKVGINTVTPSTPLDVNGTATATAFAGPLTGDVTGNADTATALETARTIGGVSFDGTGNINLPGVNATGNQDTSGNATTATTATNVTVADESSDSTCNVLFVTAASGNLAPKSGSNLTFSSSSGTLSATGFIGELQGDCLGNATSATTASYLLVTDESADTTCFPLFVTAATGSMLLPKTGTNLSFNSSTGVLTATGFAGPLTGNSSTATALATGRTIGMTGDVVWTSASFDGSGNVTGAATIQAASVDESMLEVSNAPTNGYVLTARSGNTGGMTWEDLGTAYDTAGTGVAMAIALG